MYEKACHAQSERALLFRLARNLAIDLWRTRHVRATHTVDLQQTNVTACSSRTPEELVSEKESGRFAQLALQQLNEKQRECLLLRIRGFSYREIALVIGVNQQSIGPTLARALRTFRMVYAKLSEPKATYHQDTRTKRS